LDTDGRDNVYMAKEVGLNSHINLAMGIPWDVAGDEVDLPYRYSMSVVEGQEPRLYGWYPGSHLMHQRLVDVLHTAGVNNLQLFPAEVVREGTSESVPGYVTVNVVGRVSCAVMSKSTTTPLADVHYFHDLVIDAAKAKGLLMFRLDESPMLVLVHEQVANAVARERFAGLTLTQVAEASAS
jgi:hypothetical protein